MVREVLRKLSRFDCGKLILRKIFVSRLYDYFSLYLGVFERIMDLLL